MGLPFADTKEVLTFAVVELFTFLIVTLTALLPEVPLGFVPIMPAAPP